MQYQFLYLDFCRSSSPPFTQPFVPAKSNFIKPVQKLNNVQQIAKKDQLKGDQVSQITRTIKLKG